MGVKRGLGIAVPVNPLPLWQTTTSRQIRNETAGITKRNTYVRVYVFLLPTAFAGQKSPRRGKRFCASRAEIFRSKFSRQRRRRRRPTRDRTFSLFFFFSFFSLPSYCFYPAIRFYPGAWHTCVCQDTYTHGVPEI